MVSVTLGMEACSFGWRSVCSANYSKRTLSFVHAPSAGGSLEDVGREHAGREAADQASRDSRVPVAHRPTASVSKHHSFRAAWAASSARLATPSLTKT